jgi:hypothetical protein
MKSKKSSKNGKLSLTKATVLNLTVKTGVQAGGVCQVRSNIIKLPPVPW